ncbi:MAG: hypothetical protein FWG61_03675 [Firmicutes bacterium]|nr:hypothetical protein [Bacillota bacterium]
MESESAIPEVSEPHPFTSSGTGTVVDNATDSDDDEYGFEDEPEDNGDDDTVFQE